MSLVQHASATTGTATGSTTLTITLGAAATIGNCLIVCLSAITEAAGAPAISSVTIGGSADHFSVAKSNTGTSSGIVAVYTDQNIGVSSTSVVITVSAASVINADVYEWSGIKTSAAVDKTAAASNTSSTTFTSGSSGVLTQASEVAFGVTGQFSSAADTITGPASPWTNEPQLSTNDATLGFPYDQMSGYQQVSATTALTYNGTNTSASTNTVIVTLELAPPPSVNGKLLMVFP